MEMRREMSIGTHDDPVPMWNSCRKTYWQTSAQPNTEYSLFIYISARISDMCAIFSLSLSLWLHIHFRHMLVLSLSLLLPDSLVAYILKQSSSSSSNDKKKKTVSVLPTEICRVFVLGEVWDDGIMCSFVMYWLSNSCDEIHTAIYLPSRIWQMDRNMHIYINFTLCLNNLSFIWFIWIWVCRANKRSCPFRRRANKKSFVPLHFCLSTSKNGFGRFFCWFIRWLKRIAHRHCLCSIVKEIWNMMNRSAFTQNSLQIASRAKN